MPMKFLIITFLLAVFLNNSFCQTRKLDSLNSLINKATSDTARINHTNDKISLLQEVNLDSGIALDKLNLAATRSINYKKGEADCEASIATIYCFKGFYDSAKKALDSAFNIYNTTNDA